MPNLKYYMLMCKESREIQENWKPENTDIFINEDGIIPVFQKDYIWDVNIIRNIKSNYIWLPTQKQLQNMLKPKIYNDIHLVHILFKFVRDNKNSLNKNSSMEELCISILMKEKFHKIWNREKWDQINSEIKPFKIGTVIQKNC